MPFGDIRAGLNYLLRSCLMETSRVPDLERPGAKVGIHSKRRHPYIKEILPVSIKSRFFLLLDKDLLSSG